MEYTESYNSLRGFIEELVINEGPLSLVKPLTGLAQAGGNVAAKLGGGSTLGKSVRMLGKKAPASVIPAGSMFGKPNKYQQALSALKQ